MKIKVNRKTITLFEGATIRHALLRYCALKGIDASTIENITVYDRFGHETDLDAPASQHDAIRIKTNNL
ncbi:MAG: hypothetical protein IJR86_07470 [Bacteroidaceae bacterium]|nr:hypothetical protein [Bacteroidaceae bacterium]